MTEKNGLKSVVSKVKARVDAAKDTSTEPAWIKQVAMLTGVLAAVSGFFAVRTTMLTNDAIYESNQAILSQTQSSDAWSEYQADSIKAHVVATALATSNDLDPANREELTNQAADFKNRQPALKQEAAGKAKERDGHLQNGLAHLNEKDLLGYAGFAAQIGIALASVAALVRMKTAFYAGVAAGVAAIAIALYAMAAQYGLSI